MNAHFFKNLIAAVSVVLVVMSLSSCWYVKQAASFLGERARAVPVDRILADPKTPGKVAVFLDLVQRVRDFSVDDIGLSPTRNYTRYVALDKDYVADVVSACARDSFQRHYWRYPILGALPYKGFYDRADAEAEAARLKKAGLDVIVRRVDAFSSRGYFTDPLYSFMADYDEDVVAELIIHESAHATLFIKGADQFNEEFATFVGRKGAERYLEKRYGAGSEQLAARRRRAADGTAFTEFLKGTAALLEDVYLDESLSVEEKIKRKGTILAERAKVYRSEADTLFAGDGYRAFDMGAVNNAYIDLYRLYEEDLALFDAWFVRIADGSLTAFIDSLSALAKSSGKDIKTAMATRLEG